MSPRVHTVRARSTDRTRLADIAAHADVSTATVSRVLNGKAGVAAATRRSVLAALDILGYERPDRLRQRSAGLVGLVVPELSNPVFPLFAQVIESALAERGYTAVLCTQSPGGTTEDEYVAMLLEHGVDGIVFVSGLHADTTADPGRYAALRARGLPIVLVNGHQPDLDVPSLSTDDAEAVDQAVRHLVSLGHERIGLALGPERFVPSRRKQAGFAASCARHLGRGTVDDSVVWTLYTVEGGAAAAGELMDRGHTAIICGSDLMALGAIRAARARGLSVPGDMSVVGYDDSPLNPFTDPALTSLRQPVRALCRAAVDALVSEIDGVPATRRELLFHPELVVRASTGAVRR